MARGIMDSLIANGKVTRGYLGVMIQQMTPELAKAFKIDGERGVLVGDVMADSPAALSALQRSLPHYGRQSWLVFEEGRVIGQGAWPVPPQTLAIKPR